MANFTCGECVFATEHPDPKKPNVKICRAKAPLPARENYADNSPKKPIWPEVDPNQNACGDAVKQ